MCQNLRASSLPSGGTAARKLRVGCTRTLSAIGKHISFHFENFFRPSRTVRNSFGDPSGSCKCGLAFRIVKKIGCLDLVGLCVQTFGFLWLLNLFLFIYFIYFCVDYTASHL